MPQPATSMFLCHQSHKSKKHHSHKNKKHFNRILNFLWSRQFHKIKKHRNWILKFFISTFMQSDSNKLGWTAKIQPSKRVYEVVWSFDLLTKQFVHKANAFFSIIHFCMFFHFDGDRVLLACSVYVCPVERSVCMPFCVYCASMCVCLSAYIVLQCVWRIIVCRLFV